jgi:hypothetical protein
VAVAVLLDVVVMSWLCCGNGLDLKLDSVSRVVASVATLLHGVRAGVAALPHVSPACSVPLSFTEAKTRAGPCFRLIRREHAAVLGVDWEPPNRPARACPVSMLLRCAALPQIAGAAFLRINAFRENRLVPSLRSGPSEIVDEAAGRHTRMAPNRSRPW